MHLSTLANGIPLHSLHAFVLSVIALAKTVHGTPQEDAKAKTGKKSTSVLSGLTTACSYNKKANGRYELGNNLDVQLEPHFASIDSAEWNKLVPADNFFMQEKYLAGLEKTAAPNLRFHYAVVRKNEKPVLAAVFQVIHIDREMMSEILAPLASSKKYVGFIAGWREWIKKGSDNLTMQVLVSGNNFVSGEYGLCCATNMEPAAAFDTLAGIVRVILKHDRDQGLISTILVKDYYGKNAPSARRLKRARYHEFLVEPEMIVDIDPAWKTFEGYQEAMSKKYRNRLKTTIRKTGAVSRKNFTFADIVRHQPRIMELYLAVHNKAKFRLAALTPEYFAEMKKTFSDRFRFTAYYLENELIGFRTSFDTGRDIEAHFIGIDYARNAELGIYQLMLYDYVREGIEKGADRVFLGRTASEIKSSVGARAHDLTCFIRHRNSFSNQIIRPFIDYLRPSEWIPRNPFKDNGTEE
ncbi:MAG: hypothetical protein FD123_4228 [Bacteroidetes bacterium]|nr:MAG: hypothetical protein FD123_4228 [Bacteroidota bacterium]